MNRVSLVGRIVNDLELLYTPTGKAVCKFVIAVKIPYKVKENEKDVDFFNIVVWGKTAENLVQWNKKGYFIAVDGSLKNSSYEKDGQRKWTTQVIADKITFIGKTENNRKNEDTVATYSEDLDDEFDALTPFIDED